MRSCWQMVCVRGQPGDSTDDDNDSTTKPLSRLSKEPLLLSSTSCDLVKSTRDATEVLSNVDTNALVDKHPAASSPDAKTCSLYPILARSPSRSLRFKRRRENASHIGSGSVVYNHVVQTEDDIHVINEHDDENNGANQFNSLRNNHNNKQRDYQCADQESKTKSCDHHPSVSLGKETLCKVKDDYFRHQQPSFEMESDYVLAVCQSVMPPAGITDFDYTNTFYDKQMVSLDMFFNGKGCDGLIM